MTTSQDTSAQIDLFEAVQFVIAVGYHIRNSSTHSWFSDSDAEEALISDYELLTTILGDCKELTLQVTKDAVYANGHVLESASQQLITFREQLLSLQLPGIIIKKGISDADFRKLLEVLEARPFEIEQLGGFEKLLKTFEISHAAPYESKLVEVKTTDTVVDKRKAKKMSNEVPEETVGNVLAFLKGEGGPGGGAGAGDAAKSVEDSSQNPDKLAELIMQAAQVQQQATPIESGETLVDFVVGCLKKTHKSLLSSRSAETRTGRKRLTKNLLLLEEQIFDRMRAMKEEWDEEDLRLISEATEDVTDEMKIDSLADEYVTAKERQAKAEEEMRRLVEQSGSAGEAIQERLAERGVGSESWNEIFLKKDDSSGSGSGEGVGPGFGGGGGGLMGTMEHLEALLDSMDRHLSENPESDESAKDIDDVLGSVESISLQVQNVVANLGLRVNSLLRGVRNDRDAVRSIEKAAVESGQELSFTRDRILGELGEMMKEMQPCVEMFGKSMRILRSQLAGSKHAKPAERVMSMTQDNISAMGSLIRKLEQLGEREE